MTTFRWLHLTDLHRGLHHDEWLWPTFEELFLEDLGKLHAVCGDWDLVIFSGDLTQRGDPREFAGADDILSRILARIRRLQSSEPLLLAVPGNHDLVRPGDSENLRELRDWHRRPDLRERFWNDPDSPHRTIVKAAFTQYEAWWKGRRPADGRLVEGLLPGDFSFVLEKNGFELGIVGLNSTFLQLEPKVDYLGRLDLHARQFHEAGGGRGTVWVNRRHLALLVTHHPPEWLCEAGLRVLNGDVAPPGRFAVHLFGHQHEAKSLRLAVGGHDVWRRWQGDALFGLTTWGERGELRRHGYSAGSLEARADGRATLRLWPRRAVRQGTDPWRLAPAFEVVDLGLDQGTRPEDLALRGSLPPRSGSSDLRRLIASAPRSGPLLLARSDGAFAPPAFEDSRLVAGGPPPRTLRRRILAGFRFRGCTIHSVTFEGCDLTTCRWHDSNLVRLQFVDCRMRGMTASGSRLRKTFFHGCDLEDALLLGVRLDEVEFRGCTFQALTAAGCTAKRLEFNECSFGRTTQAEIEAAFGPGVELVSCTFAPSVP